jgi:hypothetical protein
MSYLQLLFLDRIKLLNKNMRTQHANLIVLEFPDLEIFLSAKNCGRFNLCASV